jgi:ParB-like chromosome segregation protein Spo0J
VSESEPTTSSSGHPGEGEIVEAESSPDTAANPGEASMVPDRYEMRDPFELRPHPFNVKVYGEEPVEEAFIENVRKKGIYVPLKITPEGKITDGHRRYAAAVKAKLEKVPVLIHVYKNELEEQEALIDQNRHRTKTNVMITREFKVFLEIEKQRAAERMGGKNFTQADFGKARDFAAKSLGLCGGTLEKGVKVEEQIDLLRAAGKTEKANELEAAPNQSFDGAYKLFIGKEKQPKAAKAASLEVPKAPLLPNKPVKTASKSHASETPTEMIHPAANIITAGKSQHDLAMEHADSVATFVRTTKVKKLTDTQKRDWARALGPIMKWFKQLNATPRRSR